MQNERKNSRTSTKSRSVKFHSCGTPQRYYIDSYADVEEVEEFARLIVKDCAGIYEAIDNGNDVEGTDVYTVALSSRYFGVSG